MVDEPDDPTVEIPSDGRPTTDERPVRPTRRSDTLMFGDRYRILERLAVGGMGEVLIARDELVGRDVVIKRMRETSPLPGAVDRFLREARLQGRLVHPAIVPVHEIGVDSDGGPFFVMKRIGGTTLSRAIKHGDQDRFSTRRLLRAFVDVCLAVEYAHIHDVIHRDLKPTNIMLGDFGEVHVLDWGVAKLAGDPESGEFADISRPRLDLGDDTSTNAGTAVGTPGYMAPEQAHGTDVDARLDVYALGCVLFEILAGEPLYPRDRLKEDPRLEPPIARPSQAAPDRTIAPELDALCLHATATDRTARIATARELGERVQRFLDGDRDLALRHDLGTESLARAQTAYAAADHKAAMQHAGRAMALDPKLAAAADLVGRLMLEPPKQFPPEVDGAVDAEDTQSTMATARFASWIYAGFLLLMPFLHWISPPSSNYVALLVGLIFVGCGLCRLAVHSITPFRTYLLLAVNGVIIAIVARMYSPFLIAPGLAVLMTIAFVITPLDRRLALSFVTPVVMALAIVGQWLLERFEWVSKTTNVAPQQLVLSAPAVDGRELPTLAIAALYTVILFVVSAALATGIRRRERELKRHLHLQSWQLRQLVAPGDSRPLA